MTDQCIERHGEHSPGDEPDCEMRPAGVEGWMSDHGWDHGGNPIVMRPASRRDGAVNRAEAVADPAAGFALVILASVGAP